MNILLVPTIRQIYNDQFEYCVDKRLINLFQKIFVNSKVDIYNNTIIDRYDLIVFSGGNSSNLLKKKDKIRNNMDKKIYNFAIRKKIKILGICHGTQFLAKKFGFKLQKKSGHVGKHKVLFNINGIKSIKTVNSYHNDAIKKKKSKFINIFGIAYDDTVEAFHISKNKILGIMWHPERYPNIKDYDKKLIKEFYATNSIISW